MGRQVNDLWRATDAATNPIQSEVRGDGGYRFPRKSGYNLRLINNKFPRLLSRNTWILAT